MRHPAARASLLVAAWVGLGLLVVGCENPTSQADKTVTQQVEDAQAKNTTLQSRPALITALDKAAMVSNASPAARSSVKLQEARHEIDIADSLSREIGDDEIETARLVGQIQLLTAQISNNNLLVEGLRKREPQTLLKGVDDAAAAAKGSGDATWGAKEGTGVPSASMVDAQIAKLNADIQKLTDERDKLDAQQKQNTEEARKLDAKSSASHGKEARDAGVKAAALRKEARDATIRIEQIDREMTVKQDGKDVPVRAGELAILKGQLDLANARKAALAAADKGFQDRKAQIDAGWAEVKKRIDAYQDQSKGVLEGKEGGGTGAGGAADAAGAEAPASRPGAAPTTRVFDKDHPPSAADVAAATRDANIKLISDLIKKRVAEADGKRELALKTYKQAADHVKEAQAQALKVVTDVTRRENENPQSNSREAWDTMKDLFNASDFNLQLASIQVKVAHLQANQADSEALLAKLHGDLDAVLKKAGLQTPDALPNPAADKVTADRDTAKKSFDEAETTLETVAQIGSTPQAKADQVLARQLRASEKYARAQYAYHAGDTEGSTRLVNDAKQELQELQGQNALPEDLYLSPELAAAVGRGPKSMAPLPGTQPTAAPVVVPSAPRGASPATVPTIAVPTTPAPASGAAPATTEPAPGTATPGSTTSTTEPAAGSTPATGPAPSVPPTGAPPAETPTTGPGGAGSAPPPAGGPAMDSGK